MATRDDGAKLKSATPQRIKDSEKEELEIDGATTREAESVASQTGPGRSGAPQKEKLDLPEPSPSPASSQPVGFIRQHELVDRVRAYDPQVDEDLLNRAYVFSMRAHGSQKRKSGDPYFTHPLAVASILTELKADPATVATALLHDVVEDTDTTVEDIDRIFGGEIAALVDGVTKVSAIELKGEASKKAENFRKLVMAMADDVRVLLVKLADRLHNMRTLEHHDNAEKRRKIALETLEIFAPLAGRVGVQRFREELEERSFKEISPQAYETIAARLDGLQQHAVGGVVELAQTLREKLSGADLDAEVFSREKRPYSIWRKMSAKNASFDELADIYAFRVLVDTIEDCYKALGVIHSTWRMIPSEFDDYISAPKPNGYQSIHTAVIGPPRSDGSRQRIEIQIRTRLMHENAERGIAAHWQYKDQGAAGQTSTVEIHTAGSFDPYETPRRLVEMFAHGEDLDEALKYARLELFQDQVFCFTPKGRVIALPKGATPLDFAYGVHTDIGDSCIGAKINGVAKPLRTPLNNGDVVTILRSDAPQPPAEWETLAITGRARSAIRRRIRKMERDDQIALGRSMAEAVFDGAQLELTPKAIKAALSRLSEKSVDEVFAKVGRGDLAIAELVEAVYPGASLESEHEIRADGVSAFRPRQAIDGLPPKMSIRVGQCCSPVRGERIVGIKNEDGWLTVHAIHCAALAEQDPPQERWVDLRWRESAEPLLAYAKIVVTVRNEIGVLSEVAGVIARYGVSIANIALKNRSPEFVDCFIEVMVEDIRQLEQMLSGLRAQANAVSAERFEGTENEQ